MVVRKQFLQCGAMLCATICTLFSPVEAEAALDQAKPADSECPTKTLVIVPENPAAPSVLERNLFWSTWWCYHATFIADFTMTGMILRRGGREADPLYTLFGNKNMAGVIGSAIVVHAVVSLVSLQLFKMTPKHHGAWRFMLDAVAFGVNSYFIGVHTYATISNINLYNNKIAK
jgi:hypothetical protein